MTWPEPVAWQTNLVKSDRNNSAVAEMNVEITAKLFSFFRELTLGDFKGCECVRGVVIHQLKVNLEIPGDNGRFHASRWPLDSTPKTWQNLAFRQNLIQGKLDMTFILYFSSKYQRIQGKNSKFSAIRSEARAYCLYWLTGYCCDYRDFESVCTRRW